MTERHFNAPIHFDPGLLLNSEPAETYGALALQEPDEQERLRDCARLLIANIPNIASMSSEERIELSQNSRNLSDEEKVEASRVLLLGACIVMGGRFLRDELPRVARAQYYPISKNVSIHTAIREQLRSKSGTLRQSNDASGVELTAGGINDFAAGAESINFAESYLDVLQYRLRAVTLGSVAIRTLAYINDSIPKKYKKDDPVSMLNISGEARVRLLDEYEAERLRLKHPNSVKTAINLWINEGCLEGTLDPGPLGITGIGRSVLKELAAIHSIKPQLGGVRTEVDRQDSASMQSDREKTSVPVEIAIQVERINAAFQYMRAEGLVNVPNNIDPAIKYAGVPPEDVASEISKLAQFEVKLTQRFGVPKGVFAHAVHTSKAA